MKKIVFSISIIIISSSLFLYLTHLDSNDDIGEIRVDIVDENDNVESYVYSFDIDDSLFDILDDNHYIQCANSSYQISDTCNSIVFSSRVILGIDDVVTDWNNTFISIYENGVYSNLGIDSIILNDNDYFRFEYSEVGN